MPNNIESFTTSDWSIYFIYIIILVPLFLVSIKIIISLTASYQTRAEGIQQENEIKNLNHENQELISQLDEFEAQQTLPEDRKHSNLISVSENDTKITTALEEYKSLRAEILQQNQNRSTTLSFGNATLAALAGLAAYCEDKYYLSGLILFVFIPLVCLWIIFAWTSDTATLARIGSYLSNREFLINEWITGDTKPTQIRKYSSKNGTSKIFVLPLLWETSLRNQRLERNERGIQQFIQKYYKKETVLSIIVTLAFLLVSAFSIGYQWKIIPIPTPLTYSIYISNCLINISIIIFLISLIIACIEILEINSYYND
ncbi:MAG: hypothetical protein AAGE84_28600 [Cyanobacteria bacterium P01_G01_bin.39]